MSDEARRLLKELADRLGHEAGCNLIKDESCDCEMSEVTAFLAQPTAAREAVLTVALKGFAPEKSWKTPYGECAFCGADYHVAVKGVHVSGCRWFAARALLADTSPAVAALLAQGEALKEIQEWQEEWDGVGTVDWAALSAIFDRAALAPVCGTCGGAGTKLPHISASERRRLRVQAPCPGCGEEKDGDNDN